MLSGGTRSLKSVKALVVTPVCGVSAQVPSQNMPALAFHICAIIAFSNAPARNTRA